MDEERERLEARFRAFVEDEAFPCLAGKGVVRRSAYTIAAYGALSSPDSAAACAADLGRFTASLPAGGEGMRAFVATFGGEPPRDEADFEAQLWTHLQRLHHLDRHTHAWDPAVSVDPESPAFSFSFGGHALFVVGMHAASSRLARRFDVPALLFNPRAQFDRLRAEGHFERLRDAVRARDVALQGSPNPNLADYGEASEARQYSGRAVEPEWRCPFHHEGS
jgi:uncharacterized protein